MWPTYVGRVVEDLVGLLVSSQHGKLILVSRQGGVTRLRGVGVFCGRHAYTGRQLAHQATRGLMRR